MAISITEYSNSYSTYYDGPDEVLPVWTIDRSRSDTTQIAGTFSYQGQNLSLILKGNFSGLSIPASAKTFDDLPTPSFLSATFSGVELIGMWSIDFRPAVNGSSLDKFMSAASNADYEVSLSGNDSVMTSSQVQSNAYFLYAGNDTFYQKHLLQQYNDVVYGGSGTDKVIFSSARANFQIKTGGVWNELTQKVDLIGYTITDSKKVLNTTQIHEVERIQFSDKTLALDFSVGQNGYKAAMFVGAAFGAKSLSTYFSPAVGLIDSGTSVAQLSQLVIDLGLIDSLVGSSNKAFVNHVYKNVVGVAPDPFSEALYVNYLNQGIFTKASLLELASTVPLLETQVDLVGLQTNGIEYLPFL